MLTLHRRVGESIIIGDPSSPDAIVIAVVGRHDNESLRIGVEAPRSVTVNRAEVSAKILEESGRAPAEHVSFAISRAAKFLREREGRE